ncbi:MAG: hypothetical protein JWN76_2158 [Chitinophagaceae bacterium]|nr:hypothetical protein [Chitinophagaceae bacterium]
MRLLTILLVLVIAATGCQHLDAMKGPGEKVKTATVSVVMENSEGEIVCPYADEAAENKESALTEIAPTLLNIVESKFAF